MPNQVQNPEVPKPHADSEQEFSSLGELREVSDREKEKGDRAYELTDTRRELRDAVPIDDKLMPAAETPRETVIREEFRDFGINEGQTQSVSADVHRNNLNQILSDLEINTNGSDVGTVASELQDLVNNVEAPSESQR